MIITNKRGLSECFVILANKYFSEYDKVGWRSVTNLNDSPRYQLLKERHDKDIVQDISDLMPIIHGQAIHAGLCEASKEEKGVICEQRVVAKLFGREISLKPDRLEPIGKTGKYKLKDYKSTKVGAWQAGGRASWTYQANLYRLGLLEAAGMEVVEAQFELILLDWHKMKVESHNYPPAPIMPIQIDILDLEIVKDYLRKRIELFEMAEKCDDSALPLCTDSDRWARPDFFSIMKHGASKAYRNCETRAEAENVLDKLSTRKQYTIVFRAGESVRCKECQVKQWCSQYMEQVNPAF